VSFDCAQANKPIDSKTIVNTKRNFFKIIPPFLFSFIYKFETAIFLGNTFLKSKHYGILKQKDGGNI